MKPWGAVSRITKAFRQIAKFEDLAALDGYVRSADYKRMAAIAADHHVTIMNAYQKAKAKCQERRPVPAKGTRRAQWDERMIARLKDAWARHGNPRRVAQELNITEGAALAAYGRHVQPGERAAKAPSEAQDARQPAETYRSAPYQLVYGRAAA